MAQTPTASDVTAGENTHPPQILGSSTVRNGVLSGPPDAIQVEIRYQPYPDTVEKTTVSFTVDENRVARIDEEITVREGSTGKHFIPVFFASQQVKQLPSVDQVEGIPPLNHIFRQLEGIVRDDQQAPEQQTTTQRQEREPSHTPAQANGQRGSNTVQEEKSGGGDVVSGQTPTTTEEVQRSDSEVPNDQPVEPHEHDFSEQTVEESNQPAVEDAQPHPTESDRKQKIKLTESDIPEEWNLQAEQEGIIVDLLHQTTEERIAVWENEEDEDIKAVVVYYLPDGTADEQHMAESYESARAKIFEWVEHAPTE